jgi:hypothetical protein
VNKIRKPIRYIIIFLAGLILYSCEKDKSESVKESLQQQDWVQMTGFIGDTLYSAFKTFYRLSFRQDDTYYMIVDWGGVSSIPDTVTLDTIQGNYEFDPEQEKITFPEEVNIIYLIFGEDVPPVKYFVYFTPWKILQVNDTLLMVKSDSYDTYTPPQEPAFIRGGGSKYCFIPSAKK